MNFSECRVKSIGVFLVMKQQKQAIANLNRCIMKTLRFTTIALMALSSLSSCQKETEITPASPPTPYFVRMTDAPAAYLAVNIDLRAVEVTGGGTSVALNVNPGVYNLLNFSNGLDTLIATGTLNLSRVEQIRLILGSNNSIVTSTGTYPLKTPSAQQSGLKLNVHQDLQPGVAYYVLLDFDASQSIVENGNGDYSLKPVIRAIEVALTGSIKGRVSQPGVAASVTATAGGMSYSTAVNAQGDFVVSGLPAGTYTLTVNPVLPYAPVTLGNIQVSVGSATNVGILTI